MSFFPRADRRRHGLDLSGLVSLLIVLIVLPGPAASARTGCSWRPIPSVNQPETTRAALVSVSAISSSDVWAVGSFMDPKTDDRASLIEHWDGVSWSIVPVQYGLASRLNGVSAATTDDVWAVGGVGGHSLIEHWNGAVWNRIASPNQGNERTVLLGVDAYSSTDVWAVGTYRTRRMQLPLIEHWDGSSWHVMPSPPAGAPARLSSVSAAGPDDVWAVGEETDQTLVEHWNGSDWRVVETPDVHQALGVSALGPDDVWVGGWLGTMHWDGSTWSMVPQTASALDAVTSTEVWSAYIAIYRWDGTKWVTSDPRQQGLIESISGTGENDVWALTNNLDPYILHWDGTNWSTVSAPVPTYRQGSLIAVGGSSSSDVWALGSYPTIAEHWDGSSWSRFTGFIPGGYWKSILVLSSDDVWTVGEFGEVAHWDGTAWSRVPSPILYKTFTSVTGTADDDIWAVRAGHAFHWDGSTWTGYPLPGVVAATALSPSDVWAVGSSASGTRTFHWNGSSWSQIPSPHVGSLDSVAALGPANVWAAGSEIVHWDGHVWKESSALDGSTELAGLAAVGGGNIWAAGTRANANSTTSAVIWHWNGSVWSVLRGTDIDAVAPNTSFSSIAAVAGGAWAVGSSRYSGSVTATLTATNLCRVT